MKLQEREFIGNSRYISLSFTLLKWKKRFEFPNWKVRSIEKNWENVSLTLSWRRPLSYRNQSIDLLLKSMDWFLYDIGLRHERVKNCQFTYKELQPKFLSETETVTKNCRGGSKAAATSKMERFVIIVNGFQPLTITTKRSILDVVGQP